jgi:hypothetical protein
LHEPKDDGLLAGENAHLVTFLIITQPPVLKTITPKEEYVRSMFPNHVNATGKTRQPYNAPLMVPNIT